MELWLRTDEHEEAVSALEMVAESSALVLENCYRWKWVLISTHNTLQGFMVLSLRQGNGLKALKDHIAEKWLKAYREGGKYPAEQLDTFLNLYKKVKSDQMIFFVHSKPFVATHDHDKAVKKLNSLRNEFIHFAPKGWSLELAGLPKTCLNCLEVADFLGWQSGNVPWYEEEHKERAEIAMRRAIKNLKHAETKYEEAANK
ncbi:hypothetical protein ACOJCM_10120 [Billgrantia sp. LNSP4103-1]|uniref:hypothetical protein n=1 Tax=Billgrantia sp. LNSP4103-1 TaxID=3410266 RepID=UPI00403F6D5E